MARRPSKAKPLANKAKGLDVRILRASWLAARARVNLDLFAFLWLSHAKKFDDVLNERVDLFEFIRTANEHEFLARIVNLFACRSDTDNFPALVAEAKQKGAIDVATCATIKAQIEAADSTYQVARCLRNKVVSHQDDTYTKPEMYARAQPTLSMYIGLSAQSLAIAGTLCSARGLRPQPVFTVPIVQLEDMLAELQRSHRSR